MKNLCQLDDGKSQMTKIPKELSLALNEVADLPDICEIPDIYEVEDLICALRDKNIPLCTCMNLPYFPSDSFHSIYVYHGSGKYGVPLCPSIVSIGR